MPCIYAATFVILNMNYENTLIPDPVPAPQGLVVLYLISNYSKGGLLALSSIVLGDSIRRIRESISKVDMA